MVLDGLAYGGIPAVSLLLAAGHGLFSTNFSVIAFQEGREGWFFLWGILLAGYFLVALGEIGLLTQMADGFWGMLGADLGLLLLAVKTPYRPEESVVLGQLHVVFSFLAAIFLAALVLWVTYRLYDSKPKVYGRLWKSLWGIFLGAGLLLAGVGMVCSGLELFFTLGMVFFCQKLRKKGTEVEKNIYSGGEKR